MNYGSIYKNKLSLTPSYGWLYIFHFALAIRIAAILFFGLQLWEYESIASNVLAGRGFIYTDYFGGVIYRSFCEPLFPFLCIIVYFLTNHSIFMLGLIQAILSSAIVVVIYSCAKNLYGQRIGLLASLFVALHPGLIIYTTKQHPLILDALFISLVLLTMMKLFNRFIWRSIIVAGLISGFCILTRPTILVFLPIALITIFSFKRIKVSKSIVYAIVFFVVAAAIFLPWTIRNYFLYHEFMLTRSNTPFVFWLGNNPNFSGSAFNKKGEDIFLDLAPEDFKEKIEGLDEIGQNREFLKDAIGYIERDPLGFLKRTGKKFYYFWWFSPQAGLLYPKSWLLLYKVFYFFAFIAGLTGFFSTFKEGLFNNRAQALLIVFALLSISLAQSLFYVETRHRWAVEPLFLIFAAKGINLIFQKIYHLATD